MRCQTPTLIVGAVALSWMAGLATAQQQPDSAQFRERFGEQLFAPKGGFVLHTGDDLPPLEWQDRAWIRKNIGRTEIRTRWFNERYEEVQQADAAGRLYVYGEAVGPDGSTLRRAMTACAIEAPKVRKLAIELGAAGTRKLAKQIGDSWRSSEDGALQLAAWLEAGKATREPRVGQWQMENATRHVRLKRRLIGLDAVAPVQVRPRRFEGGPAPVLRQGSLEEAGVSAAQVERIEKSLDAWYARAGQPTAVVVARRGVIVLHKAYGELDAEPVTIDTPMLLHSAMKPLIGLQTAMYADRGHIELDEPIGKHLQDFNGEADRQLTFRSGHAHATGIYFPWPLAFSRLFYFRSWQDSMISFRTREWPAGENRRYGVVGVILAVRALELLSGRNYWDAMEREIFEPLGIRNILPGGTGFSAENLARIGVLLANRGKYGDQEFLSEEAYEAMTPTPLQPYFPKIDIAYGIGLQEKESRLGPGSYGHAGGCGTQILIHPEQHLVFSMVRNDRGEGYDEALDDVMAAVRALGKP